MHKIVSKEKLKARLQKLRQEGKTIVFTNGCFDILHVGHVRYLREAKKLGDVLILALNSDTSVRAIKGEKRPLVPEDERADIMAALECIDFVVIFPETTPPGIDRISGAPHSRQGRRLAGRGHRRGGLRQGDRRPGGDHPSHGGQIDHQHRGKNPAGLRLMSWVN